MEIWILVLLLIPFAMACFAGLYGILQHAAQAAHNRNMERLRVEGEVYNFQPDNNGNHNARYIPSIGRVIHPEPGHKGPEYPLLTSLHYSPNNSSSLSGKPLNVGSDARSQKLVVNHWQPKPEEIEDNTTYEVHRSEKPQEGQQPPELPESTESLSSEQAALGLLGDGLGIMQVAAATGLSEWTVRKLRAKLSL